MTPAPRWGRCRDMGRVLPVLWPFKREKELKSHWTGKEACLSCSPALPLQPSPRSHPPSGALGRVGTFASQAASGLQPLAEQSLEIHFAN